MLGVELGLYLLARVLPGRPARDAWTLFGGYPYAEAAGHARTSEQRLAIRRARHYLWTMRRRRVWLSHLEQYARAPGAARLPARRPRRRPGRPVPGPRRRRGSRSSRNCSPPRRSSPAGTSRSRRQASTWFPVRDRNLLGHLHRRTLADGPRPRRTTWPPGRPRQGEPVTGDLGRAPGGSAGDGRGQGRPASLPRSRSDWADRLGRVELLVRQAGGFAPGHAAGGHGLLHIVGMVGAGKSTLRDILTYWYVTSGQPPRRRVTIVVGDVAEALAVTDTFRRLGIAAAPVLGQSTRERNIHRLHRRLATAGAPAVMPTTARLPVPVAAPAPSTPCAGRRRTGALRVGDAPCTTPVRAERTRTEMRRQGARDRTRGRHGAGPLPRRGCPLWSRCPRHHGARDLVTAQVWVATPASLVHSAVPPHQADERIRYLELACRMSDLIIVDEADRVQMQLDAAFAPSATLIGKSPDSWLDEVQAHKITELARQGRLQLSAQEIDDWTQRRQHGVRSPPTGCTRCSPRTSRCATGSIDDYFSPFTLHQRLLSDWFPEIREAEKDKGRPTVEPRRSLAVIAERDRISAILDIVRDDPLQPDDSGSNRAGPSRRDLVRLTLELLHAYAGDDDAPRGCAGRSAGTAPRGVPARHRGRHGRARAPAWSSP